MKIKFVFTAIILGIITTSSFSQEIVWSPKAELPLNIYSGSAVTCQEKIYFIGGQKDIGSGNFIASNRLFEYNTDMDEWVEKPHMPTARYNFAAATFEGKIYAIGGDYFLDKNEMYDPTTETWHTLTPMPTARQHIKAAVVNGKIYIIGGLLEGWTEVSSKNEAYDPLTDTWEEMAPIPTPKHNYATAVYNDKIYIFGGDTQNGNNAWVQTASVEVYDPAANTWDTSISLPTVRFNPGIGLINHSIIITGGISGDGAVTDVDILDLVSNSWSQGDSLPLKNVAMGSATLNDKIYIIGGADGPGDWIGYNEVYEGAFEEPSGTVQNTNTNELIVFPNPAKNYIQIYASFGNAKFKGFQILTIEGKAIKEGRLASNRIDVSDLRKGVFLLKIETDKGTITKRIIIE